MIPQAVACAFAKSIQTISLRPADEPGVHYFLDAGRSLFHEVRQAVAVEIVLGTWPR